MGSKMEKFKNIILGVVFVGLMFVICNVRAERSPWTEDYYNRGWCEQKGGVAEHRLPNGKRVDCLLDKYAVEADWANYKAYEAIGQSLYYAKETNRHPAVLLIVKDEDGMKWVKMVSKTMKYYHIKSKVWYIIAYERMESVK